LTKKHSKLQLVKTGPPSRAVLSTRQEDLQVPIPVPVVEDKSKLKPTSSTLSILNLSELSEGEQLRVRELAGGVIPGAPIQGIVRGLRSWDLRPLIKEAHHSSLLRLYGPEVMLSASQSAYALKQLQLIAELPNSGCGLIEFGTLDSQVFILRPLFLNSLAERLQSQERFSFIQAVGISLELVRILKSWHQVGIVHGHLCAGNICFSPEGEIFIVDPGILVAQYRAGTELGSTAKLVDEKYIAPELIKQNLISPESDIFSLGHVFAEIFRKVRRARNDGERDPELLRMNNADLEAIAELTSGMTEKELDGRAPLDFVERMLDSRTARVEAAVEHIPEHNIEIQEPPQPEEAPVLEYHQAVQIEERERPSSSWEIIQSSDISEEKNTSFSIPESQTWQQIQDQEAEQGQIVDEIEQDSSKVMSSSFIKVILIGLIILCAGLGYKVFFSDGPADYGTLNSNDLQSAWESGVPSEMALVAAAAIQSPETGNLEQQKHAERVILRAAMGQDKVSDSVNYPLIRLAFNEKWERKLTQNDRRVALTVALRKLVDEQDLPKENVDLATIHPGVIFAVIATQGNVPGFGAIPAAKLTSLPPPFNFAFQELVNANSEVKVSEPGPLGLARFWLRDLTVDEVLTFLQKETEPRLRALAILLSGERIKSKQLVEMLLNHPNRKLDHELILWGIKVKLTTWGDVDASGQLFILAGLPATSALTPAEYVQLLAHPAPITRQYAISKIIDLIPLGHPGAVPFLIKLKEKPELLTGKQTIELAQFLEMPERATRESVQVWCETEPDPTVMAELLASSAKQASATPFDSNLSICLQHSKWKPSLEILKRLATHPDDLTRIFAFTKVAELGVNDRKSAIAILSVALKKEPREDLRRIIELNLSSLKTL